MHVSGSQVYSAPETRVYRGIREEYLFYCVLHHNQDANLKDIAKHISKVSLLLTGTYGSIWDTKKCFSNRVVLDAQLRRSDLSTHGMSEFRSGRWLYSTAVSLPRRAANVRYSEDYRVFRNGPMALGQSVTIGRLRDGLPKQREFPGNSLVSPNTDQLLFFPCHLSRTARRFGRSSLTT